MLPAHVSSFIPTGGCTLRQSRIGLVALALLLTNAVLAQSGLQSSDLYRLRSVGDVQFSPNGYHIAYVIESNGQTGRPYSQLWVMTVASGKNLRVGAESDRGGSPEWSPDSKWIAFHGTFGGKSGLYVVQPDGSGLHFMHGLEGTNSP